MELINREFERDLLRDAASVYPEAVQRNANFGRAGFAAEIHYLQEHGLITARWIRTLGSAKTPHQYQITARGIDFLADDGGLGAILNVVTVRLDADSLRAMLVHSVENASGDSSIKGKLIAQIKAAPAEVLKELTKRGLAEGLKLVPDLVRAIQTWFPS